MYKRVNGSPLPTFTRLVDDTAEIFAEKPTSFSSDVEEIISSNPKVKKYITPEYDLSQVLIISDALKDGIDPTPFNNIQYNYMQMQTLMDGIKAGYDITNIVTPQTDAMVMRELIRAKRDKLSSSQIKMLNDPKYKWQQIQQLRLAMVHGIDIAELANPKNDAKTMQKIREKIEGGGGNG